MKKRFDDNFADCIPLGFLCGCVLGAVVGLFLYIITDETLESCMTYGCGGGGSFGTLVGVLLYKKLDKKGTFDSLDWPTKRMIRASIVCIICFLVLLIVKVVWL